MPLIHVSTEKGYQRELLLKLMNTIMDSVHEVLKLLPDDRNIRLSEFEPGFFNMKKPYKIILEISLFSGRTIETKRKLYKTIVDQIQEKTGFEPEEVFILLNEQAKENWGIRGGLAGCDVDLGFKVEV